MNVHQYEKGDKDRGTGDFCICGEPRDSITHIELNKSPIMKQDIVSKAMKDKLEQNEILGREYGDLTFPQAMHAIIDGHSITKLEWDDKNVFCLLRNERLTIHNEKGFHDWIIREVDMSGEDWIVVTN